MLYSEKNIEIWNFHIIAFCFYSQFVQCPNFFGIGFVYEFVLIAIDLEKNSIALHLDSYSDGTHSLQRNEDPSVNKWCNAKFIQICSYEETN